jgi:peptide/nickel transport system ATP-binding protein
VIRVQDLCVRLGRRPVLSHASIEVPRGACIGLTGPSGSGKTTLLRAILGDVGHEGGTIDVCGWRPDGRRGTSPPTGLFGIIHQDPKRALDSLWTIGDCIAEPLWRHDGDARAARIRDLMTALHLGHLSPRTRASSLSVGQAQRVAVARALAASPRVIVADEPTSALDLTSAAAVVCALRREADRGASVLVVSHNHALLESFCDGIARLPVVRAHD